VDIARRLIQIGSATDAVDKVVLCDVSTHNFIGDGYSEGVSPLTILLLVIVAWVQHFISPQSTMRLPIKLSQLLLTPAPAVA
jgi:hypothetical protein